MRRMTTSAAIAAAGLLLAACGSGGEGADPSASASASGGPSATSSILIWSDPAHADGAEGQCSSPPEGDGRRGPGPDGRHGPDQDPRRHRHAGPPGPGTGPVRRAERLGRPTRRLRRCWHPSTCPPQAKQLPTGVGRRLHLPGTHVRRAVRHREPRPVPQHRPGPGGPRVDRRDGARRAGAQGQGRPDPAHRAAGGTPGRRLPLVPVLQRGRRQDLRPRRAGRLHGRRARGGQARQHRGGEATRAVDRGRRPGQGRRPSTRP